MIYDCSIGEMWLYLGTEGKILAQTSADGKQTVVEPGESTDQGGTMPIQMALALQQVGFGDPPGQTGQDYLVTLHNPGGLNFGGGNPQTTGGAILGDGTGDTTSDDDRSDDDGDDKYGDDDDEP